MEKLSLGLLGNLFAIVVSVLSAFFAWQQTDIAREQTNLNRKSLVIEKKLQVCIDFLTTASEFEYRFENPIIREFSWGTFEDQGLSKEGTGGVVEAMKAAGVMGALTENSVSELVKITAQARLLLNTETAKLMKQYAVDAKKAHGEQLIRQWTEPSKKPQDWGTSPLPTLEAEQLNSLRNTAIQIETKCGDLAERDAS